MSNIIRAIARRCIRELIAHRHVFIVRLLLNIHCCFLSVNFDYTENECIRDWFGNSFVSAGTGVEGGESGGSVSVMIVLFLSYFLIW